MSVADETILTGSNQTKPKPYWLLLVGAVLVAVAVLVWTSRPKVSSVPSVSDRLVSTNSLKQIGLAFQNFDAKRGRLPLGAICSDDDKPLLSWRVALLPYLDEQELFDQFKHDEPWDSPHNKALIAKMPAVYASPGKPGEQAKGLTYFKVFVGEKTVFHHAIEGNETNDVGKWSIHDLYGSQRGLTNLVFVAEGGDPVVWTKPDDFALPEGGPLPNLTPLNHSTILVLMGDGSVRNLRPGSPNFEEALRASLDPENETGVQFEE